MLVEQLPRARPQSLDSHFRDEIDSRQATTLLAANRNNGKDTLTHGNRGRRPGNAISQEFAARVIELTRDRRSGANHTHLAQLLYEREAIQISRQALRPILGADGLRSPLYLVCPKWEVPGAVGRLYLGPLRPFKSTLAALGSPGA